METGTHTKNTNNATTGLLAVGRADVGVSMKAKVACVALNPKRPGSLDHPEYFPFSEIPFFPNDVIGLFLPLLFLDFLCMR
jgi:hypothetical protein